MELNSEKKKKLRKFLETVSTKGEITELRKQDKWQEADEIRKKIEDQGWKVEDTPRGQKITSFNN